MCSGKIELYSIGWGTDCATAHIAPSARLGWFVLARLSWLDLFGLEEETAPREFAEPPRAF